MARQRSLIARIRARSRSSPPRDQPIAGETAQVLRFLWRAKYTASEAREMLAAEGVPLAEQQITDFFTTFARKKSEREQRQVLRKSETQTARMRELPPDVGTFQVRSDTTEI